MITIKNDCNKTLCWGCARAAGMDMCSWAEEYRPVEGWIAEKTKLSLGRDGNISSYFVEECPLYIRDEDGPKKDPKDMDTEGAIALIEAMGRTARKDYIEGRDRRSVSWWLDGKPQILEELKRLAKEHDKEVGKERYI